MINPIKLAASGKNASRLVAGGKRVGTYAMNHKMKTVLMGSAALGGVGYLGGGRSGRGVDKMPGGRPTGIYKY